jgi:uncharacterized protein (TIGR02284 family)
MINDYEATKPMTTDAVPVDSSGTMSNADVISCLNGLIETCKDGEEGFREAAGSVERNDLKSLFAEFSLQRAQFAGVLQELVRSLGGDPESEGSISGALHRGWIDLKSALTGKDEQAILNECERGEDSAKKNYADAMEKNLPANILDIVQQQSQAILAAHNRVRALRDSESHKVATPGF